MPSYLTDLPPQVWLGGSDKDIEGAWVWSNECRFKDQVFSFWAQTQPDNYNDNEHCLTLRTQDSQWNDADCTHERNFVCEITVPPI